MCIRDRNKIGEIPVVEEKYNKDLFALKVSGDSMVDAGIHGADIVVVDKNIEPKNGDIGAFMINDTEATVKYLDTIAGKKYLIPANKNYENFEVNENTQPIGKVVSLFRDILLLLIDIIFHFQILDLNHHLDTSHKNCFLFGPSYLNS